MLKHILEIAKKDLRVFAADRKSMIISFAIPILIASFFASVMTGGSKPASKVEILVVNEDQDRLTASMISKMSESELIAVKVTDRAEASALVKDGKKGVAIIFPKGFAQKAKSALFAGEPAELEELYDPTKNTDRQLAQGALMQTLMQEISKAGMTGYGAKDNLKLALANEIDPERKKAWEGFMGSWDTLQKSGAASAGTGGAGGMRQPFEIKGTSMTASTDPGGDENAGRAHVFGGMAMQGILFFAINAAMSMLRDRRTGVWSRMKAAPVSSMALVLGNGLGTWIISFLIFAVVMAFGILVLGIRVHGSWIGLILVALLSGMMTAAYGLLIASFGKTEAQARGFSMVGTLMMLMLGGAWIPTFMMGPIMQKVSAITPVRWGIEGVDAMVFRGAGVSATLMPMALLFGFTVLFAGIAIVRMSKA